MPRLIDDAGALGDGPRLPSSLKKKRPPPHSASPLSGVRSHGSGPFRHVSSATRLDAWAAHRLHGVPAALPILPPHGGKRTTAHVWIGRLDLDQTPRIFLRAVRRRCGGSPRTGTRCGARPRRSRSRSDWLLLRRSAHRRGRGSRACLPRAACCPRAARQACPRA